MKRTRMNQIARRQDRNTVGTTEHVNRKKLKPSPTEHQKKSQDTLQKEAQLEKDLVDGNDLSVGLHNMDLDEEIPVIEYQGQLPADEPDLAERPVFKDNHAILIIYICSICDNIPWKPRQTPCGHRCCADCIKKIFGDEEVIYTCPIGPAHSENEEHDLNNGYRMSDFVEDPACQLYLNNQIVLCANKPNGCSSELQLRDLPDHLKKCAHALTSCTNSDLCTEEFLRKHKNIHDDNCRYREIKCEDCGITVTRSALVNHWNNFCDHSIERSCDVCGTNFLKRSDLKCHQRTKNSSNSTPSCLKKGGVCYFSRYGCDFECEEGNVNKMQEHLDDNYDKHMQRIVLTTSGFSESSLQEMNTDAHSRLRPIQMTLGQMSLHMSKFFQSVAESVPVFDSVPELLELLTALRLRLDGLNKDMQTSDKKNETIIKNLEKNTIESRRLIDNFFTQKNISPDITSKIQPMIEQQMMETEMLSSVPINGELLWKIEHWDNVRSAAQRNETTSIYSEFFFTSLYGYKMRLRFYPNGDGANRDRFVSCFFTIMKGPYDHILQWPFMRRMSFAVVDPQTGYVAEKPRVFVPDRGPAFCRPETEQNPATGCPNFIDLNKLNQYVDSEDDALTVICTVETSPSMDSWRQKVERYREHT